MRRRSHCRLRWKGSNVVPNSLNSCHPTPRMTLRPLALVWPPGSLYPSTWNDIQSHHLLPNPASTCCPPPWPGIASVWPSVPTESYSLAARPSPQKEASALWQEPPVSSPSSLSCLSHTSSLISFFLALSESCLSVQREPLLHNILLTQNNTLKHGWKKYEES